MLVPVTDDEWYGFEDDAQHHIYFQNILLFDPATYLLTLKNYRERGIYFNIG
jgi:hypothetical protein